MNILIRPWEISDKPSLVKYANNWKIAKNLIDKFPYPYHEKDAESYIEFANADQPVHLFAIDHDGEAIGAIGITLQRDIYRKNVELGYWLAEPFWGRGIVCKAVIQMVKFAFENYDIARIYAGVFGSNLASQRVLEKSHFTLEAKFQKTLFKNGEYQNELIYALRREDWAASQFPVDSCATPLQ